MLRPIGSLPPTVYWRRRLMVLAPLVLVAITAYVAVNTGGGSSKKAGGPGVASSGPAAATARQSSAASSPSGGAATTPKSSSAAATTANTSSPAAPAVPVACRPTALSVTAAAGAASYAVGATPTLYLQVANIGKVACIENLSDREIEMRVYGGTVREWGSHDCQIAPDMPAVTLAVNQPVRRSVVWTGLSSKPGCAGTRQRVGAGTYTLEVFLAGVEGKTTTFTLK